MDRVNQLRGGGAGGSRDSSLDDSGAGDSFLTANDTASKYYSLSEDDSFDITKDVSLASTSSDTSLNDSCFPNLSTIGKKDLLDYKIGKQIEAANILSGGVNIFDDNESSYDGNELVIDDNVEIDKSPNLKSPESSSFQDDNVDISKASTSKSQENPDPGQNVATEDKSFESADSVEKTVTIEQSSSLKSPEAAVSLHKDEHVLENLEADRPAPPLDQGEANLPINEQLEDIPLPLDNGMADEAEIHIPIDNGIADIADIAHLPENGVADVAEIALPLEEAEIGEANLPNDIGEANLPNDNVEEHSDNVAEENDDRTEVVLQIDGNNVAAISIGTGLYLYRKEGQEELAAVQIVEGEEASFKFLKVRENAEGNLEVYEEIQEVVVVPQQMPVREVRPAAVAAAINVAASTSRENNRPVVVCEPSTSKEVEKKENTPDKDPAVPSTSKQDNEPNKDQGEPKNERNVNGKMVKISESRKSPLMAYHSTPNKEGIPLTKTMVEQQLHPNRHSDNIRKTIEVHTDNCKQKSLETPSTSKCKDYLSPDKKSDEASAIDKTSDKDTPEKKQSKPEKKIVPESIEKKTEEIACSSRTEPRKVEVAKSNEDDAKTSVIDKVQEIIMLPIANNEEKKKKAESDDKSKKSIETPSTSRCIEMPAATVNKGNRVEETQLLTPIEPITATNKDLKDVKISTTSPLVVAPMVINHSETKIPEIVKVYEKPVVTPTEIIESDDMEVDEDVLVIEEQIIESQPEVYENKKCEEDTVTLAVEKKSKIIDQIKNVLGTGEAKPTSSVKNSISIVATSDISKSSEIYTTTVSSLKDIKVISNSDKSGVGNKSEIGMKISSLNREEAKGTNSKDTQLNHNIKPMRNESTQEITIPRESLVQNVELSNKEASEIKPVEKKPDLKHNTVESLIPAAKVNHTLNTIHNKPEKIISKLESTSKNIEKKAEIPVTNTRDVKTSTLLPVKEQRHTGLPNNTQHLVKPQVKSDIRPTVTNAPEAKKEMNHKLPFTAIDPTSKTINNNHAPVPFGKWTEVNRQDFLNKIKESKPVNISNANQIKQPNDLNRRDVLKKIDSQRQTYNANVKILESLNKGNVKTEAFASKTVPATITKRETKIPMKSEAPIVKPKLILENKPIPEPIQQIPLEPTVAATATVSSTSKKEQQRKEINNQDIIDKTVEGIINRAVSGKSPEPVNQAVTETPIVERVEKKSEQKTNSQPTLLDAIEMKMNELHGIPFVERPPHELPRPYLTEPKVSPKAETHNIPLKVSKIPNLVPLNKSQQNLKNCEDDIMHLETPREKSSNSSLDLSKPEKSLVKTIATPENVSKDKVITEKEFDKFARRNSVTYENCLTVTDSHQVIQTVVPREAPPKKISRNELMLAEAKAKSPHKHLPIKQYHPSKAASKYVPQDKQYQSKLQLAYHTAITKRRIDSPITIIEDKPVKVVYLDSNVSEFTSNQLNVQGRDLSPAKRSLEPDAVTVGTCDSLDSDILDAIDDNRQDEVKTKSKHQRKQVLTPVESPELELIEPADLGFEVSPKKKRKTEDRLERRNLVPKKSYLLSRSTPDEIEVPRHTETRPNPAPPVVHNDAVSAIDSLVKAAELLDNQSENMNVSVQSVDSSQNTPVKRGRGRPRKNPLPDADTTVSPQKKPRLIDAKPKHISSSDEDSSDDDLMIRENWTMGKINEKIVCPICNKLFRSENVVFKHVKHCTGPSPSRSDGKCSPRRSRLSRESETKSRESETKSREGETKSREGETKSREGETKSREGETKSREGETKSRDSETKSKESETKSRECETKSRESETKSRETETKSRESETKSRESTKSRGSRSNDPDEDLSTVRITPKKRKSKYSEKSSSSDSVIPVETDFKESENKDLSAKNEPRKTLKPKLNPKTNNLVCEICGKRFRQLSYLVSHKLQHKKEDHKKTNEPATEKSVFSCETCKKEFRKLHHLVQHRLIHNSVQSRALRKTSSEHKELIKSQDAKLEDQSAGFRCEPCDKSFRKLHHLVEHRETHDGINRQRSNSITQVPEKEKPTLPPQCDICKKTFRKLHHLIEHKEQHLETSSEKSDDQKSVKSSLSTKDIIHECNLCYMVFPNEHSLNKHAVICLRKKKQSAAKQAAAQEDKSAEAATKTELVEESKTEAVKESEPVETKVEEKVEIPPEKPIDPPKAEVLQIKEDPPKPVIVQPVEKEKQEPKEVETKPPAPETPTTKVKPAEAPVKKLVDEIIVIEDTPVKKKPIKDKVPPSVTKRQKIAPSEKRAPSSDDDEVRYMLNPDFKATGTLESITFTEIRAKKRNSLKFGRQQKDAVRRSLLQHPPKIPRVRASADHGAPPKPTEEVPSTDSDDSDVKYSFPPAPVKAQKQEASTTEPKRRKTLVEKQEVTETAPKRRKTIVEKQEVTETDPKRRKTIVEKQDVTETDPKRRKTMVEKQEVTVRRKTMADKRKSLSGIAKRKSLGKAVVKTAAKPSAAKPIKRRAAAAEHRCDCGQLFSSAALLARHASLAHTPPRLRRARGPDAGDETVARKSVEATRKSVYQPKKSVDQPKKSVAADAEPNRKTSVATNRNSVEQRKSVASNNCVEKKCLSVATVAGKDSARITPKTPRSRIRVHTGVPVPEKRPSRK